MPLPTNFRHCFESASAAAGRQLDDNELDRVFSRAQGRMGRYVAAGMSPREAAARAGAELAQEHLAAAKMARMVQLQDLQKRVDSRAQMSGWAEGPFAKDGTPDPVKALNAKINGTTDPRAVGGRYGTEGKWIARSKDYASGILQELKKAGLEAVARSGRLDEQTWKEMHALTPAGKAAGEKPGLSGSKEAQTIAGIYQKYYALARQRLNDQGALTGELSDFVQHNSHDPLKLAKAGFEAWRDAILPKLDQARTFEDTLADGKTTPEEFLKGVWTGLRTGLHLSDEGGVGFKDPAFSGPANMAKKLSEQRLLHWKDAQSGYDYFKQFGQNGTLAEHLASSMDRAGRQEALMRDWGTNPKAEFDNSIQWMKEKYRDTHPELFPPGSAKFKGEDRLRNDFMRLTGESNRPANQWGATFGRFLRTIEVTGKLGNVLFSHLSATSTAARELQRQGEGIFESYRNALASWLGPLQGEAAKEGRDVLGAALEGAHAGLAANAWTDNGPAGALSTMQNLFMRATGLPYAIGWKKAGVAAGVARILGRQLDRDFTRLGPDTRIAFDQYGITEREWNALRAVPDHFQNSSKQTLLTPDAALRTSLAPVEREDLALKLATYLSDAADRATITPRIRDRNIILGKTQPGDLQGELWRFFGQFKNWPIAMAQQTMAAEFRSGRSLSSSVPGVVQLIAGMTLVGYLRNTLANLSQGKNPPPRDWASTWFHALAQGGGAGIYGDFLFGNSSRFGQSIAETLAGPVMGEGINFISSTYNDLRDYAVGEKKDLTSTEMSLARMVHQNLPFANLYYTRLAMDYLIFHSLQESINPGYLRRGERRLKQQMGTTYWLSPSVHAATFGR